MKNATKQHINTYIEEERPAVRAVDLKQLRQRYFKNEIDVDLNMTSIGTLVLLEHSLDQLLPWQQSNSMDDNDQSLQRLSLAHERLHSIPKILLEELAPSVKILDISNNEFDKLDFLKEFHEVTSLICDHNNIKDDLSLPYLPKLELLWMNHCKILDLYSWSYKLSNSCPNLKYLSLMGNPGTPLHYNEDSKEEIRYRLFILSMFPHLRHLDDKPVTEDEKKKSRQLYQKHLLDILAAKAQQNLPEYVRRMSQRMSLMLPSGSGVQNKNFIV